MKDLGYSVLLFLAWILEKLLPAMLAQQAVVVSVILVDLEKDHATSLPAQSVKV